MPMIKDPRWIVTNKDGTPMVGANMFVRVSQSSNLVNLFYDSAMTVAAPNPLISNDRGIFPVVYAASDEFVDITIVAPNGITVSDLPGMMIN